MEQMLIGVTVSHQIELKPAAAAAIATLLQRCTSASNCKLCEAYELNNKAIDCNIKLVSYTSATLVPAVHEACLLLAIERSVTIALLCLSSYNDTITALLSYSCKRE
jgi:hypothetical protein